MDYLLILCFVYRLGGCLVGEIPDLIFTLEELTCLSAYFEGVISNTKCLICIINICNHSIVRMSFNKIDSNSTG